MENVEWDFAKAEANLAKHGVDFADALYALFDERAVILPDDHPLEERFVAIGIDGMGRCVVVAYTWRGERIRMISARKATRNEARLYAAGER